MTTPQPPSRDRPHHPTPAAALRADLDEVARQLADALVHLSAAARRMMDAHVAGRPIPAVDVARAHAALATVEVLTTGTITRYGPNMATRTDGTDG